MHVSITSDAVRSAVSKDEQAIRSLVATWHRATAAGDVETVLTLMAEDVVFLVAGQPPMRGRSSFERGLRGFLGQNRIESTSEIQEIQVSGDLAYCWSDLSVRVTPVAAGNTTVRTGSALSILRRQLDGSWVVVRDANMLSAPDRAHTPEIFLFTRLHARPGRQAALRQVIHEVQGPTREEPGCPGYLAFQSVRDADEFFVHSHWRDRTAFDRHAGLPHTMRFVAAVEALVDHPLGVSLTERLE